jgi:hypothetical protein
MFRCTEISLPLNSLIKREATVPIELRPHGFIQAFDSSTVFYDVIALANEERIVLVGPPLRNLMPLFCSGRINGHALSSQISLYYLRSRSCDVWIDRFRATEVRLDFDFGSYTCMPSRGSHELYAGKRVLYTLSKNNNVNWIVDWVRFHVANHGANAVLIYDNSSTIYTIAELEQALRGAFPHLAIHLAEWPFKYGPAGISTHSEWGEAFCQEGAFQDARFRFLGSASSVLNCDIDELVVSTGGDSIFAATEASAGGYISFGGKWIANVTDPSSLKVPSFEHGPRHGHFQYLEPYVQYLESNESNHWCHLWPKWCVVPQRCQPEHQWRAHVVEGKISLSPSLHDFSYRHFRGISTNWYCGPRGEVTTHDRKVHKFDKVLNEAFVHAGL